ncbi:YitT family protein [Phascolarctobacterium succinatutens]|uniref:YitT family protein n=1 Tax=Phascolarctobacterium succinatutens TaxID=626940 RepID=UPI00307CF370
MKAVTYLRQFLSPKAMCLIIGGSLVYSIGFNMFILPCNLYNGGFLGIAQMLGYFMRNVLGLSFVTDSYIGIIYFLLNIPLMLLAIRKFGKDFLVKSAVCITSYSVLLSVVPVAQYNYLPDTITACLAGGILCGLGCGMTLMSKGSGGGEGILGLLLMHRYHNMSVGKVFNIINIFVFGSCILLYDVAAAVYSSFFAVITSVVLDKAYLPSITVTMIVITKIDLVEEVIFAAVHRGVTKIKGIGAYSGEDTNVLLTVVSKVESMKLRHLLEECDPNIFIIEYENVSVIGNFEKRL